VNLLGQMMEHVCHCTAERQADCLSYPHPSCHAGAANLWQSPLARATIVGMNTRSILIAVLAGLSGYLVGRVTGPAAEYKKVVEDNGILRRDLQLYKYLVEDLEGKAAAPSAAAEPPAAVESPAAAEPQSAAEPKAAPEPAKNP
jgi:hypothetical protein